MTPDGDAADSDLNTDGHPQSHTFRIDWFDRKLITFVLSWAPYNGVPEEDTFIEFGMSTTELMVRFVQIVTAMRASCHIQDDADRDLLHRAIPYFVTLRRQAPTARRTGPDPRHVCEQTVPTGVVTARGAGTFLDPHPLLARQITASW